MRGVFPRTEPIWASSHVAPSATQPPREPSTLPPPKPATWEAAEPARPETPDATWHTGPRPAAASAEAGAGQPPPGRAGTAASTLTSVDPGAGVVEEGHDARSRYDQEDGQSRDEDRPPADEALLVVLAVRAEGPGRRADDQSHQGQGQGPELQAVHEVLEDLAPGELARVRAHGDHADHPARSRVDGLRGVDRSRGAQARGPAGAATPFGRGCTGQESEAGKQDGGHGPNCTDLDILFQYFSCYFTIFPSYMSGSSRVSHWPAMLRLCSRM